MPNAGMKQYGKKWLSWGWSGILVPEKFGGSEFGMAGISVIMQELGETLTPSPILSTSVLGVSAINMLGSDEQKENYLPKIVADN